MPTMTSHVSSAAKDNIAIYQQALDALEPHMGLATADVLALQHKAVLALARAGASDFAQKEYERYGLTRITQHEDIMALAGRLAKDRFEASGDIEEARASANFYETAFQSTGGYYSGINAATMSMIAKVPPEIVMGRAQAVLTRLSALSGESDEERYFLHATRAEAQYILGDKAAAASALQAALDYDPLNYTAHASTYRQFRLLARAHGEEVDWLAPLRPPCSVHFAGHLFAKIKDEDRLAVALSDLIQKHDIGFGYGALAAGSDIVFAECLLAEGGQLHIILPVPLDVFKAASVSALDGDDAASWSARFDSCVSRASSVRCVTALSAWPEPAINNFAARVAMGQACANAAALSSASAQLLIWDGQEGASLTAYHAKDWQEAADRVEDSRVQLVLEFPDERPMRAPSESAPSGFAQSNGTALSRLIAQSPFKPSLALAKNGMLLQMFETSRAAVEAAQQALLQAKNTDKFGLHIAPHGSELAQVFCEALSKDALPGSLLVSQDMAAIIALDHSGRWDTGFTGWSEAAGEKIPAFFAKLSAKDNL